MQVTAPYVSDLLLAARIAEQRRQLERILSTDRRQVMISSMSLEHTYSHPHGVFAGAYYWELTLTLSYLGGAHCGEPLIHEISPDQNTPTSIHMRAVLSALHPDLEEIDESLGQEFGMNYTHPILIEF